MIRFASILFTLALTVTSFAAGTIQVDGKLHSFNKDQVVLLSDDTIYYIDKAQLTEDQKKMLKTAKVNATIALTVNFKSITKVETVKK